MKQLPQGNLPSEEELVSKDELIWAAGFFDGEGTIGPNLSSKNFSNVPCIRLGLSQVDRRPLDRFCEAVNVGTVQGPHVHAKKSYSEYYTWKVAGMKAIQVLILIEPWLSQPKSEQAIQEIAKVAMIRGSMKWGRQFV